ncbi:MAG: 2OG-Fe(II) oxygenase family protein, partial [Nanoarchaeota archaeon]
LYNFRSFLISKEFREFIHEITGIKIKPNSVDVHAMKMENTHYMLCHTDMELNRKIAFMFYFSENFEEKDGGKLILRDKNLNIVKKLTPQFNSLYVMEITSNSYHDIEEITSKNPRITIGGWFE